MSQLVPFGNSGPSMQSAIEQVVVARAMNSGQDETQRQFAQQTLGFVAALATESVSNSAIKTTESIVGAVERLSKIQGIDPAQLNALLGVNQKLQSVYVDIAERGAKHL